MKIALPIAILLHLLLFLGSIEGKQWRFVGGSHGEPTAGPIVVSAAQPVKSVPASPSDDGVPVSSPKQSQQGGSVGQSELVGWGNPIPAYPEWEKENDIEGVVEVEMTFHRRNVRSVHLKKSSGSIALDNSVLETVKAWKVPEQIKVEETWMVPVSFEFRAAN